MSPDALPPLNAYTAEAEHALRDITHELTARYRGRDSRQSADELHTRGWLPASYHNVPELPEPRGELAPPDRMAPEWGCVTLQAPAQPGNPGAKLSYVIQIITADYVAEEYRRHGLSMLLEMDEDVKRNQERETARERRVLQLIGLEDIDIVAVFAGIVTEWLTEYEGVLIKIPQTTSLYQMLAAPAGPPDGVMALAGSFVYYTHTSYEYLNSFEHDANPYGFRGIISYEQRSGKPCNQRNYYSIPKSWDKPRTQDLATSIAGAAKSADVAVFDYATGMPEEFVAGDLPLPDELL